MPCRKKRGLGEEKCDDDLFEEYGHSTCRCVGVFCIREEDFDEYKMTEVHLKPPTVESGHKMVYNT